MTRDMSPSSESAVIDNVSLIAEESRINEGFAFGRFFVVLGELCTVIQIKDQNIRANDCNQNSAKLHSQNQLSFYNFPTSHQIP